MVAEVEGGGARGACDAGDAVVGAGRVVCWGDQGEVSWVDAAGVVAAVGDIEF